MASTRRSIPMRHRELGILLAGEQNPGLPTGGFIEVKGENHSGKTTLAFACADAVINQPPGTKHRISTDEGIEVINAPRRVLYMDFEHALDIGYATSAIRNSVVAQTNDKGKLLNGRDANLFIHQPDTLEEGGDLTLHMIASGEFGLVVMDSVAAMLGQEEADKSMSENTMGLQSKAIGKFLRKSAHMVRKYGVTVILVNQWRDKIGKSFGDPRTSPGGKATAYYDSIVLDVMGSHTTPWFEHGKVCKIKSMKNKITGIKVAVAEGHIGRGVGISAEVELTQRCLAAGGILEWKGGLGRPVFLTPLKRRKFESMKDWLAVLRKNDKLFDQLSARCDKAGVTRVPQGNGGFDDDE